MKISACLIVKNEKGIIERCINSFKEIVNEIIVVDTGSEDDTKGIAKMLGAKVYDYKWNDDFAAARNYALDKASYDWIIFLDADEYFDNGAAANVKSIIEKIDKGDKYDCIYSRLVNVDSYLEKQQEKITVIRIFRNNKDIRYVNKIHETIRNISGKPIAALTGYEDKLQIIHTGYSKDILEKKASRNLKLLLKEMDTSKDKEMIYFYLVNSYTSCKDYDNAIKYAELFIHSGKVIKNYETYIPQQLLLSMLKRGDKAETILKETNKYILNYPDNHAFTNIAASIYKSQKKYENALFYYLKTLENKKIINSSEYYCEVTANEDIYFYIGNIYELKNYIEKAVEYYLYALSENKNSDALFKLLILIRQEKTEEIILLLNKIYDIDNKDDIKYLVDKLSKLKYGKVLRYYHNIWLNKFKEEDSAVIFTFIGNGKYHEAFELLFKCYACENKPWIEKFLVIAALLGGDTENINKIENTVSDFYRKVIKSYLKSNEYISFKETEKDLFLDLIEEFILISESNTDLEKLINLKYGFNANMSCCIGDTLKKWKVYDWALEEYSKYLEDKSISCYNKASCYFNAGSCCYYLKDYNRAIDLFKKAKEDEYKDLDINEYLNWIIMYSNDERIKNKALKIINSKNDIKANKLHLGCGRNILNGWINLDCVDASGVDVVCDLDSCRNNPLPFQDNYIEEFYASHLIEHIKNPLPLMEELYRIAKPGAKAVFKCPYGSSDEAYEDPTHVRQYFLSSFGYFSQPFYWRADYGYRGDWNTEKITLLVDKERYEGKKAEEIMKDINSYRNVVREMIVELKAIKPIRNQYKELQIQPKIEISLI